MLFTTKGKRSTDRCADVGSSVSQKRTLNAKFGKGTYLSKTRALDSKVKLSRKPQYAVLCVGTVLATSYELTATSYY